MKKVIYLGGGWVDTNNVNPNRYKLTIGKTYNLLREDPYYCVIGDVSDALIFMEERFFTNLEETIHNPDEVEVGKLYESVLIGDNTLYMGCQNYDTREKFLLIVVDDSGYDPSVGVMVSMDLSMPIWKGGFVKKS